MALSYIPANTASLKGILHLEYDPITERVVSDVPIETTLGSLYLKKAWSINAGGEEIFFSDLFDGINYYASHGGIKDQSIVANQDSTGLLQPRVTIYGDNLLSIEPNGAADTSGSVDYDGVITNPIDKSSFSVELIVEEEILPTDHLHYDIFDEVSSDEIYEHTFDGITKSIGDTLKIQFRHPVKLKAGREIHATITKSSGVEDTHIPLKVRRSISEPTKYYAKVGYRTYTDKLITHEANELWNITGTALVNKAGSTTLKFNDGTRVRSELTSVHNKFVSPDGVNSLTLSNADATVIAPTLTFKPQAADRMKLELGMLGMGYTGDNGYQLFIGLSQTSLFSPGMVHEIDCGTQSISWNHIDNPAGMVTMRADKDDGFDVFSPDRLKKIHLDNTGTAITGNTEIKDNLIVGTAGSLTDPVNFTYLTLSRWDEDNLSSALIFQGGSKEGGGFHPDWLVDNFYGWLRMWSDSADAVPVLIQNTGVGDAYFGINKQPDCALDVGGDAKVSGTLKPAGGVTGADGTYKLDVDNNHVDLLKGTQTRVRVNSMETELIAPDGGNALYLSNGDINFYDGTNTRFHINATESKFISPGVASSFHVYDDLFQCNSTVAGFAPPYMTTAQRDAMTPPDGVIIYNSTTAEFNFRENGAWVTKS